MATRRYHRGYNEDWAKAHPELVALMEESQRRRKEWQFLAPGPDKPSEWEFALQLLAGDDDMKALFERYELSPNNPFDWRALLEVHAHSFVRKKTWTRARLRRFAADLYVYREQAGSWNARKAIEAMKQKSPWKHLNDVQYLEKLVGEQNKIARFKEDGCFVRLAKHYDGELFLDEVIRSRSGKEVLPWDEDDWRWD